MPHGLPLPVRRRGGSPRLIQASAPNPACLVLAAGLQGLFSMLLMRVPLMQNTEEPAGPPPVPDKTVAFDPPTAGWEPYRDQDFICFVGPAVDAPIRRQLPLCLHGRAETPQPPRRRAGRYVDDLRRPFNGNDLLVREQPKTAGDHPTRRAFHRVRSDRRVCGSQVQGRPPDALADLYERRTLGW